jgi:hypothetical protein
MPDTLSYVGKNRLLAALPPEDRERFFSALKLPVALCKRAFDQSLAIRTAMLRFAGNLLDMSAQTAACNRLHSIEQRCARWLLRHTSAWDRKCR